MSVTGQLNVVDSMEDDSAPHRGTDAWPQLRVACVLCKDGILSLGRLFGI